MEPLASSQLCSNLNSLYSFLGLINESVFKDRLALLWMSQRKSNSWSPSTLKEYKRSSDTLIEWGVDVRKRKISSLKNVLKKILE